MTEKGGYRGFCRAYTLEEVPYHERDFSEENPGGIGHPGCECVCLDRKGDVIAIVGALALLVVAVVAVVAYWPAIAAAGSTLLQLAVKIARTVFTPALGPRPPAGPSTGGTTGTTMQQLEKAVLEVLDRCYSPGRPIREGTITSEQAKIVVEYGVRNIDKLITRKVSLSDWRVAVQELSSQGSVEGIVRRAFAELR